MHRGLQVELACLGKIGITQVEVGHGEESPALSPMEPVRIGVSMSMNFARGEERKDVTAWSGCA